MAQQDAMSMDGGWPTTCWQPGESFEDSYALVVLKPLAPGTHRLKVGFYWLPSGERLPVSGQGAQPDHSVDIGTIEVESP